MEYDTIARLMGCEPFVMSAMRVNPFDSRICKTYSQLLAMATLLASFGGLDRLDVRTKRTLRVAVLRMFKRDPIFWTPAGLLDTVRTLCEQDVADYHDGSRSILIREYASKRRVLRRTLNKEDLAKADQDFRAMLDREITLSSELTLAGKEHLFDLLDDVFSGPDADLFGDSHGMFDMYAQRASVRQWTGFASGGIGETIMRTLDAQLRSFAIENGQMELLAHLELDDERHRSISNIVNARASAYFSKIARSLPIVNLSATQRMSDLRKGDVGSEHYLLGESIIDDLGGVLLARQRGSKAALDEIQERYVLTNTQRAMLPRLPKYTMFLKPSEEYPASLMQVFATPTELPLLKTDQSNEQLLKRPGIAVLRNIERYAEINGVKLIGAGR